MFILRLLFRRIKKYLPKGIVALVVNFFYRKKDKDEDEDEEEKRERAKEADTFLLLGLGTAVMSSTFVRTAKDDILNKVSKFEIPEPKIDWDKIFGTKDTEKGERQQASVLSAPSNFWSDIMSWYEKPKGAPKGFRQAEKIQPVNIDKNIKYSNINLTSVNYGNPMNIRPRMNADSTEITERQQDIWRGETGHYFSGSGAFVAFADPYYSFRAAAHLIMSYQKPDAWHNKHNIHDWIYTYCPTKDKYSKGGVQDSQGYVNFVVSKVNSYGLPIRKYDKNGSYIGAGQITEYDYLDIRDKNTYITVIKAMAEKESGTIVSLDYLKLVYEADINNAMPPTKENLASLGNGNGGWQTVSRSVTTFYGGKSEQPSGKRLVKAN